ncbi:hypothetical protein CSOJ01_06250 [Colletotrichum sojae]|uniref:Uncharacterized protein n=1 Tax=Colletotrichum sojae TaxID=2175907 RepID=A0A8H6MWC2_9PEZI|nr:hypothetical protein CSOJ01_06250 [Colletotrichum sojae]
MSANRKEHRSSRNVTFEPTQSVRGHRQQASDSGVGSDHDSYGTSPDRSAQAYYDLHKAHIKLKDELAKLQENYTTVKARVGALENTVEVLEDDKEKLLREKRTLKDENEKLREDLRKARGSTREPKMTGALPTQPPSPKEKSRRSESKVRRSGEETTKEREKRHKEDKDRLKSRFDHKDKDDKSTSSNSSSGRSRRESYVEPYGPPAPRPAPEPARSGRSRRDSTYSQQARPQVHVSTTMPGPDVYSAGPRTSSHPDYESAVSHYEDSAVYSNEDGHYHPYPLPSDASSRGRSQW